MHDVLTEINAIFRDVFEDDDLAVGRDTTAADVEGWDSLQHVSLILRVERHFGVRLSSANVADMKSVGDLVDIVAQRRAGA